jgi:hypothetical protein
MPPAPSAADPLASQQFDAEKLLEHGGCVPAVCGLCHRASRCEPRHKPALRFGVSGGGLPRLK